MHRDALFQSAYRMLASFRDPLLIEPHGGLKMKAVFSALRGWSAEKDEANGTLKYLCNKEGRLLERLLYVAGGLGKNLGELPYRVLVAYMLADVRASKLCRRAQS